jgi:hypothetical protein
MSTLSNKTRWSGKRRILVAFAVTLIVLFLGICIHGVHRVDPRKIERSIEEQLPSGSDKTKVIAFLDANHIAHSAYLYHNISADIDRSTVGLFPGRIYIEFRFDENDKLKTYRLHEIVRTFWP